MIAAGTSTMNPYRTGGPIRDPEGFFGREEQLRTIVQNLAKGDCTSVVGQRRVGKTSLLYQVQDTEVRERYVPDPHEYLFLHIERSGHIKDGDSLIHEMIRESARQVPEVSAVLASSEPAYEKMYTCLDILLPRRLVLLLDDVGALASRGHFTSDFFSFMRALAVKPRYCVGFVTTSQEHLKECCPVEVLESPFFNIFKTISLGSFSESELDEFLTQSSQHSRVPIAEYKDRIVRLAGRFPYFVQLACWHYFEAAVEDGETMENLHEEVDYRFTEDAMPHLAAAWDKHLGLDEQMALALVLEGEGVKKAVIRRLEDKGYVLNGRVFSSVFADLVLDRAIERKWLSPRHDPTEREMVPPGVWMNRDRGEVYVNGEMVAPPLTPLQYRLMSYLWENSSKLCSKDDIVVNIWGDAYDVNDNRIAKLVDRLRDRIEPDPSNPRYATTVRGRGYRLVAG